MNYQSNCPICLKSFSELFIQKDSCKNNNIESECIHQICILCLREMSNNKMYNCPLCRENIYKLIKKYEDIESSDSEKEEDDDDDLQDNDIIDYINNYENDYGSTSEKEDNSDSEEEY